ncbi:hypothetical protein ACH5RR_017974 [Cinchona calisaya]|uniref:Uncharacterized protein n=1 Tax=Cinchona calisaya TaxID=153742 RepID=A0ABD2ZNR5_9GENT
MTKKFHKKKKIEALEASTISAAVAAVAEEAPFKRLSDKSVHEIISSCIWERSSPSYMALNFDLLDILVKFLSKFKNIESLLVKFDYSSSWALNFHKKPHESIYCIVITDSKTYGKMVIGENYLVRIRKNNGERNPKKNANVEDLCALFEATSLENLRVLNSAMQMKMGLFFLEKWKGKWKKKGGDYESDHLKVSFSRQRSCLC